MKSRILGRIELDCARLQTDIDTILKSSAPEQDYSEYRFGTFLTYVLRNPTGEDQSGLFRGAAGLARTTALGASLAYIDSLIQRTFHIDALQMTRAYLLQDALLIPHRDYVEFEQDAARMVRLHVPILTNPRALHSEDETVFHMRPGEVWFLDVTRDHAACNAASVPRLSLVLDFLLDGAPMESVFRDAAAVAMDLRPEIVHRPPLDPGFDDDLHALARLMTPDSFRDIVQLLSRVHFYRAVPVGRFFDWLDQVCQGSAYPELVDKAARLRRFLVASRALGERFDL